MSVGKRIFLKREMPDPEVMAQFKSLPASQHCRRDGPQLRHETPGSTW